MHSATRSNRLQAVSSGQQHSDAGGAQLTVLTNAEAVALWRLWQGSLTVALALLCTCKESLLAQGGQGSLGPLLLEHRLAAALGGAGCFVTWQTRHQSQCTAFILASLWSLSDASSDDIDCRVFLFLVFRLWDISCANKVNVLYVTGCAIVILLTDTLIQG